MTFAEHGVWIRLWVGHWVDQSLSRDWAIERIGRDPAIVGVGPLQLTYPAPGGLSDAFIELQPLALGDAGDPPPIRRRSPQQVGGANGGGFRETLGERRGRNEGGHHGQYRDAKLRQHVMFTSRCWMQRGEHESHMMS